MASLRILRGDDYTRPVTHVGNSPLGQVQFYSDSMDRKSLRLRWRFLAIGLPSLLLTATLLVDVWHARYERTVLGLAMVAFIEMLTFWAVRHFVCRLEIKELGLITLTRPDYIFLKVTQPSAAAYYATMHPECKGY